MVEEARFEETESGFEPVSEGWFVVNVADTAWWRSDVFGASSNDRRRRNRAVRDPHGRGARR